LKLKYKNKQLKASLHERQIIEEEGEVEEGGKEGEGEEGGRK
jgi:hypothetical protein